MLIHPHRASVACLILILAVSVPAAPGELEEREAPLYAAALLYIAGSDLCNAKRLCCYSVGEAPPSPELAEALRGRKGLEPLEADRSCEGIVLDAWRVSRTTGETQKVRVGVGGPGFTLISCTHVLNLTAEGWIVDPSKDSCPVM